MKNIIRAIKMEYPETIPLAIGTLPSIWLKYGSDFDKLLAEYPQFFKNDVSDFTRLGQTLSQRLTPGTWVDNWGCTWGNAIEGNDGIVIGHPLQSEEDIFSLKIPDDRSGNDIPHGFMYLRLLDLFGFENAMVLFAEEDEALKVLIDKVLEYNIYQFAALIPKMGPLVIVGDDLGMQKGLAIGADRWRKYLKPCFRKLFGMLKAARPDVLIYMHTDGCIHEIMPDLVECGVDMVNPQFRANGLDNLVRVCRKEQTIALDLDLDRQLFPFATRSQIFDHIGEAVEALYLPQGGLSLKAELNHDYSLEQMAAILDALEKYRHYKG